MPCVSMLKHDCAVVTSQVQQAVEAVHQVQTPAQLQAQGHGRGPRQAQGQGGVPTEPSTQEVSTYRSSASEDEYIQNFL